MTLSWTGSDTGSGVASYDVRQSQDGGAWDRIAERDDGDLAADDGHARPHLPVHGPGPRQGRQRRQLVRRLCAGTRASSRSRTAASRTRAPGRASADAEASADGPRSADGCGREREVHVPAAGPSRGSRSSRRTRARWRSTSTAISSRRSTRTPTPRPSGSSRSRRAGRATASTRSSSSSSVRPTAARRPRRVRGHPLGDRRGPLGLAGTAPDRTRPHRYRPEP